VSSVSTTERGVSFGTTVIGSSSSRTRKSLAQSLHGRAVLQHSGGKW
jgi:hypothetical protein